MKTKTADKGIRTQSTSSKQRPIRAVRSTAIPSSQNGLHPKSLLVPVDFSDPSRQALDAAVFLASMFGAQINLVHVVESSQIFQNRKNPLFAAWDRQRMVQAKTRLDELKAGKIDELIPAHTQIRAGRVYREICAAARSLKANLIVIGTHGFTGLKHLFLGSTAEQVVRYAPCSVLVMRGKQSDPFKLKPKKIMVPTDFSRHARHAVDYAAGLARQFNAQIHLLYVAPTYCSASDEMMMDICRIEGDWQDSGATRLHKVAKALLAKGVPVKTQVRRGRPATEIAHAIKEFNCDLAVISTHGLTGWNRVLLGSTTEEVVRHAACPVLVVRKN